MKNLTKKTVLTIGAGLFLLYLCIHFWPTVASFAGTVLSAASPLFMGALVAYIVNLLMRRFESRWFPRSKKKFVLKTRRPICMFLSYLSFFVVVALVLWLVIPQLISCIRLVIGVFPQWMESTVAFFQRNHIFEGELLSFLAGINWNQVTDTLMSFFTSGLGDIMTFVIDTVAAAVSTVVNTFLSFIFSLYFLFEKDKLLRGSKRLAAALLPEKGMRYCLYFFRVFHESFRGYIIGQSVEAVILGLLCAIGMLIFRFPYVAMISALVAFTALIPVAGAYIGAIVGAFMILTVSPLKAILFLVFIIILQQLEGNLIYPKVVGTSLGLPGLWVLAAVVIGGGIMGILGMLIGVPFAGALYRILKDFVNEREKTKPALTAEPKENA